MSTRRLDVYCPLEQVRTDLKSARLSMRCESSSPHHASGRTGGVILSVLFLVVYPLGVELGPLGRASSAVECPLVPICEQLNSEHVLFRRHQYKILPSVVSGSLA